MAVTFKIRPGDEIAIGDAVLKCARIGSSGKLWLAIEAPRETSIVLRKAERAADHDPQGADNA